MSESNSTVEYRDIQGFRGYRVGSDGTVWSRRKQGRWGGIKNRWVKMKCMKGRNGHLSVNLQPAGVVCYVHRLILEAFVGPCPDGMECCHFPDPDPANCSIANLRWDNHENNMNDAVKQKRHTFGSRSNFAKLTQNNVDFIRKSILPSKQLAILFGVISKTIQRVRNGSTWVN